MPISFVGEVAFQNYDVTPLSGAALTLTAGVSAGQQLVILAGVESPLAFPSGIADSQGNFYPQAGQLTDLQGVASLAIYAGPVAHALSPGDTIHWAATSYPTDATHSFPSFQSALAFDGLGVGTWGSFSAIAAVTSPGTDGHYTAIQQAAAIVRDDTVIVGIFGTWSVNADHATTPDSPWVATSGAEFFRYGEPWEPPGHPNSGLYSSGNISTRATPFYGIVSAGAGTTYHPSATVAAEAWWWDGVWAWFVPTATPTGAKPANVHFRSGEYFSVHATSSGLQLQRANFGALPFVFAGYATSRADDESPSLYEGRQAELCCVFTRADPGAVHGDAGVYWINSLDDGETWGSPLLLLPGGDPCAAKDEAGTQLAGAVQSDGSVKFTRRYPGESAWETPFVASSLDLVVGKPLILFAEPAPVGRWFLIGNAGATPSGFVSMDEGETWASLTGLSDNAPCAGIDGAGTQLMGYVGTSDFTLRFRRRYAGEASFSSPFVAQLWNGSSLSNLLLETGKGTCLSAEPGPVGRWLLVATPHGSSSLTHYQSIDEGESWVVVS